MGIPSSSRKTMPAARRSSKSPLRQRPVKIRESCDNCGILKVKCGRQRPQCQVCIDRGLTCSYSPSRGPATHSASASAKEEKQKPSPTASIESSFDPFFPRPPSTIDPRSSLKVSAHHDSRTLSGVQATGLLSTDHSSQTSHVTDSSNIDVAGTRNSRSSPHSHPEVLNYSTGAQQSALVTDTYEDFRSGESSKRLFDAMADKHTSSTSGGASGPSHGSIQDPPNFTKFDDDFSSDFDFDALCAALTPSTFLASMPKEVPPKNLQNDPMLAQNIDGFPSGSRGDNFAGLFPGTPKYQMDIRKTQDTLRGILSCSEDLRTCLISALQILQSLHIPPPACLSACEEHPMNAPRQPRMIDSVLSTNREVVQLVSGMLKCQCSSNSQVQLVLTIICGKLIAWYRAMMRNDYNNSQQNSASSHSSILHSIVNNSMNDDHQTERVYRQPITVGGYSFDIALESKIRAQVVFSELQHLEGLVEHLSCRIQEAKFGSVCTNASVRNRSGSGGSGDGGPLTPDEPALAEAIHKSLIGFLNKQLQAAKAESAPLLGSGDTPLPTPSHFPPSFREGFDWGRSN